MAISWVAGQGALPMADCIASIGKLSRRGSIKYTNSINNTIMDIGTLSKQ